MGAQLIDAAAEDAPAAAATELGKWRKRLAANDPKAAAGAALDPALAELMAAHDPRPFATDSDLAVPITSSNKALATDWIKDFTSTSSEKTL